LSTKNISLSLLFSTAFFISNLDNLYPILFESHIGNSKPVKSSLPYKSPFFVVIISNIISLSFLSYKFIYISLIAFLISSYLVSDKSIIPFSDVSVIFLINLVLISVPNVYKKHKNI